MTDDYTTQPVTFESGGTDIAAVMYRPRHSVDPVPCVVMAHGFSGTMGRILPEFADVFARGDFLSGHLSG